MSGKGSILPSVANLISALAKSVAAIPKHLFPIKELFGFGDEIGFVYHLIPELQRLKKVENVFGVNLRENQSEVSIFKYPMEMIQNRIKELANAEGKESTITSY